MRVQLRNPARLALALAFGLITASAAAAQEPTPQPQPAPPAPAPAPDPQPAPEPAPAPAPAPEMPAPEKCEIVIDAASVPVNTEPVTVRASFSRAIGETVKAEIAPESGIKIVSAEPDAETPLAFALILDTSAATAGDWALALTGEDGACAGTIAILPASPPPSR